jgi:hypothetical protein
VKLGMLIASNIPTNFVQNTVLIQQLHTLYQFKILRLCLSILMFEKAVTIKFQKKTTTIISDIFTVVNDSTILT